MKKTLFYIIVILSLITGSIWFLNYQSKNVLSGQYCSGHMRMYCDQDSFGYGMLGMLITWVVIVLIGIFIYKLTFSDKDSEAINILNKKLANGDISIEEYHRIKNEIEDK